MRILYAAIDQTVPGTVGGSVHVEGAAEALAARGHQVHVLAGRGPGDVPSRPGVHWIWMRPPFGAQTLRWLRTRAVVRLAREIRPDVVIERYYNFGGEGIAAGRAVNATTVLEVNAPVVDFPGSRKAMLDKALLVEPMRRWRERLCAAADLIVAPAAEILPPSTPPAKIVRLEWGADTDRFRPDAAERPVRASGLVAVFAGAFRSWHGAISLVRAVRTLRAAGRRDVAAVLIGDGPELARTREEARGVDGITFLGAVPHHEVPAALARADVGVAPFDVAAHRPLSLGFYWSPLKIFEYMATGLPVVAPAIDRIPTLVGHEREGILYDPGSDEGLTGALERLTDSALRNRLGRAARDRALREYSWAAHAAALEGAIRRARGAR